MKDLNKCSLCDWIDYEGDWGGVLEMAIEKL